MVVIALVINAFLALSLVFFQATRKTYPGFGLWTAGVSFLGVGYLAFCLRGAVPDSISILIANGAFPLGMVLQLDGMRRFLGLTPVPRIWYVLPVGALAAAAVFYYGYDSAGLRTVVTSTALSAPHFAMALLVLRQPVRPSSMFYGVIGSLLALGGVMILGRGIWSLYEPRFHMFLDSPLHLTFFVSMVVLQLGESLSFIMLNSERVERELVEAEAELSRTVEGLRKALAEQKRTEASLRESEEKYRNLFNNAEVGMFRTRQDGSEILDMNDKFLRIFNRTREEMQGNPSVIHWLDPREREEMIRRLNSDGRVTDFECKMLNKQGEMRICMASLRLYEEQGILEGSLTDITDLKEVEKALKDSEQRQRLAQDAAKAGTWEWDLLTNENFWSDELWTLYGLEPHSCEPSYKTWLRTIHPDDRAVAERSVQEAAAQRRELNAEWRTSGDGGNLRWLMSRGRPVYDENGQVIRYIGIVIDITDRKRAEEALTASEEKYRLLVEKAREAIFVVQDTVFRFINPSCEEILGLTADQLLGNSFAAFVHPEDREAVVERHYRRLKGEILPSRYTIRIIDGQKREKWAELDSMLIDWEGKSAVMVFLTDITYRKLAEQAVVQAERLRAIADLSGGVAHHFNNLLQIIMGNTSLSLFELESGDLPQVKSSLEKMLAATKLGAETVRRLQTFANIRADVTEEESAVFDVADIARNAADISRPLWKAEPEKRGTKVNLQLNLEQGCLVQGKENEIFEVLVNLIRNAAEAMPDGGNIEVKASKKDDEVVIKVRDTGMGIADEDISRVFQPFWSTRGVGIGKGMGLAVTHGLVKRHGGTISVHSQEGAGTTFTIRLPLAPASVARTELQPMDVAAARLTILIIDDEPQVAALLERILTKASHTVFKALSGEEGLTVFHKESVDLVICDLGMPGMSGWDVGKAIRSICREKEIAKPAFVLLTGWGGQDLERAKIAESGTDAVVAKPIDSASLLATVQEIAERNNLSCARLSG
jgi:PAS domain S-box-containing protein